MDRRIDALNMKDWATGNGLRIGDPRNRVTETYGEPDSSGPSMRDSKELEILRYRFGWAGNEVPQEMTIYCARERAAYWKLLWRVQPARRLLRIQTRLPLVKNGTICYTMAVRIPGSGTIAVFSCCWRQ